MSVTETNVALRRRGRGPRASTHATRSRDSSTLKNRRNHAQKKAIIEASVLAKTTFPSRFAPSPAYSAAPPARKACSESVPRRTPPLRSHSAISANFARCCGWGRRLVEGRRFRDSILTSRTHKETDDFATPSFSAMSTSAQFCARSRRASACSATLPRYPTTPRYAAGVTASLSSLRGSRGSAATESDDAASPASSTRSGGSARV